MSACFCISHDMKNLEKNIDQANIYIYILELFLDCLGIGGTTIYIRVLIQRTTQ